MTGPGADGGGRRGWRGEALVSAQVLTPQDGQECQVRGRRVHLRSNLVTREHRGSVTSVSVSEDGEFCLSCASDGAAILWRLPGVTRAHLLHAGSGNKMMS